MKVLKTPRRRNPLQARLSKASGSIRQSSWLPPQWGELPRIRFGKRWINVLWAVPIAFVVLVLGIAVCQGLYATPWFQQLLARYPGIPTSAPAVNSGFPLWLRVEHFLNMLFMFFIIRAGIQILRITRASIGTWIARPKPTGSAFSIRFQPTGYGGPKTTGMAGRSGPWMCSFQRTKCGPPKATR